ncbi:DUF1232 domain-containing protein [Sporolactobacillus sp. THM7-7]|nr:DUF1232 domain-containing protein [Sporolactobacillus sp. THM7-7]
MTVFRKIKRWAKTSKAQLFILYFACKDRRTPWYAKVFAVCIVAYAFSPIDAIPDFIPILGFLDDMILLPLAVMLVLKAIPKPVIEEARIKSQNRIKDEKPVFKTAAVLILLFWAAIATGLVWIIFPL